MSIKKASVIIVDAGNTRIKVAAFLNDEIVELKIFQLSDILSFNAFVFSFGIPDVFVSSVLSKRDLESFLGEKLKYSLLSQKCKLPIDLKYQTPESLGLDRMANAAAIQRLNPEGCKLSIDLGTCIKFDFVNEVGEYMGGSISPGLRMRYKALNHFTGKLPLLDTKTNISLIGMNSQDSIHSGVINGMQGELNHFMESYRKQYQGLTFFVTGGDAKYFEFDTKNNIFAHENLTLFGLYYIYKQNA
ncbi:MAG: type III pantothenate kinase [Bacteroidota bacterium]